MKVRDGILDAIGGVESNGRRWQKLYETGQIPAEIWKMLVPMLDGEVRSKKYLLSVSGMADQEATGQQVTKPKVTRRPGHAPVARGLRAVAVAR